jgi:acetylornithine deacetylase
MIKPVMITEDILVDWTRRVVRAASEQSDEMEQDAAIQTFVTGCVRPLVESYGFATRVDGFGNLLVEAGPAEADMEIAFLAYAMTHPRASMQNPFDGELLQTPAGAVIRGRGVSEQKASLAASLAAFIEVASAGALRKRCAWLLLTAGETGRHDAVIAALAALGSKPRFGILAIGTDGQIALGSRGRLDLEVTITGLASHSSAPWLGADVTKGVREVLARAEAIGATLGAHPGLGPATLTCTKIRTSPDATHTVQSEARMVFDRRLLPEDDPEAVLAALRAAFVLDPPLTCVVSPGPFMYGSLLAPDAALIQVIGASLGVAGLDPPGTYFSLGTLDAGYLLRNGIQAVKWGPGDPGQFHTAEERVLVADITLMAARYKAVLTHLVC